MKSRRTAKAFTEAMLNHLLPRHCVMCGCCSGAENLCLPCLSQLPRCGHSCMRCGLPLRFQADRFCSQCLVNPPPWDFATAALTYRFPADQLVCRLKFNRNLACGRILARELVLAVRNRGGNRPGCILPVPLHRLRQFTRAFNQADVMARWVGKQLAIPVVGSCLHRHRRTNAQSGLDATARKNNIKGAFSCRIPAKRLAAFGHVALIDDVMTTGATLAECTKSIKKAGAEKVSVWVAARAPEPHQVTE